MRNLHVGAMLGALAAGAAMVVGSHVAYGAEQPAETEAQVVVVPAAKACFPVTVHGTGILLPASEAVVTIELDNYQVTDVLAHEGDQVKAGQPLARLSHVGPIARGQDLPSVIVLHAPSDGKIEQTTATIGAVASSHGAPLFRIATSAEIEMDVEVPSPYLDQVAVGQRVDVGTATGHVDGRVRLIASSVDEKSQLGHVRVSLAATTPSLLVGSFMRASIDAGQSCGVSVPKAAVLYGTDGTSVQVVRGQVVEKHKVRIGFLADQNAEIKAGVAPGDMVVAHGSTSLRDGEKVRVLLNQAPRRAGQP